MKRTYGSDIQILKRWCIINKYNGLGFTQNLNFVRIIAIGMAAIEFFRQIDDSGRYLLTRFYYYIYFRIYE
jgi:hypothetical protein